jgi:hypothetical protein
MTARSRCARSTKPAGDLYAIEDEIEALKLQIASLPSRAYVSRLALMATARVWAGIMAAAMLVK